MWGISVADLSVLGATVLTLVVLEGLLSADNALVLAVMVRHLPKEQQKRALRYGILGAFVFRLIAVLFAATLLQYWMFKVVGGLYLLYLAISHFATGGLEAGAEAKPRPGRGFWSTVAGVELADIAFSIDSILAAVAMADGLPHRLSDIVLLRLDSIHTVLTMELAVVYVGGILGIITMRYVAGYFITLLDKFAGLASGAYFLVAWIGLKLVGGGAHDALHPRVPLPGTWRDHVPFAIRNLPLHMPEWLFWSGMGLILVASLLYRPKRPATTKAQDELARVEDA